MTFVRLNDPFDRDHRLSVTVANTVAKNLETVSGGGVPFGDELLAATGEVPKNFGDGKHRWRILVDVLVPVEGGADGLVAGLPDRLASAAGRERRRRDEGNSRAANFERPVLDAKRERVGVDGGRGRVGGENILASVVVLELVGGEGYGRRRIFGLAMAAGDAPAATPSLLRNLATGNIVSQKTTSKQTRILTSQPFTACSSIPPVRLGSINSTKSSGGTAGSHLRSSSLINALWTVGDER